MWSGAEKKAGSGEKNMSQVWCMLCGGLAMDEYQYLQTKLRITYAETDLLQNA